MASRDAIAERRRRILALCRGAPQPSGELARRCGCSQRTVQQDLRALSERFGERLQETAEGYLWTAAAPHPIPEPPTHLDHYELVALVAARGLLRDPRSAEGGCEPGDDQRYPGLLAGVIDDLLARIGLRERASAISPEAIAVSRFAALVEEPGILVEVVDALLAGDGLIGDYTNLDGRSHDVHLAPVKLVLVEGEFHLLANDGRRQPAIKDYRLARFASLRPVPRGPDGCPPREQLQTEAERHLATAFRSTGSSDPAALRRIVVAIAPPAVPHLRDRRWGLDQVWMDAPADLPAGWARLTFTTAGLAHARHELLGHGADLVVEQPPELRDWIANQAQALLTRYRGASKTGGRERRKNRAGGGQDGADPGGLGGWEAAE